MEQTKEGNLVKAVFRPKMQKKVNPAKRLGLLYWIWIKILLH